MLKLLQVSEIVQGKHIRSEKDSEIFELAESIERQGLINPITVQERDDGKYEVIAGHRRFEAIKRLGYPHVECNILDDLNEKEIILAQIAENCQRKQMSASELVDTFEDLKERFRMNQAAIAKQFGKSDTWVSNQYQAVRLLASQYGEKVPKAEKKKTAGQIKNDVKKMMAGSELIIAEGMKIQVIGHKYTIFCQTNEAENELRDFIKSHKTGR
jgi:ParB/RepB/Spo0J family partition protein